MHRMSVQKRISNRINFHTFLSHSHVLSDSLPKTLNIWHCFVLFAVTISFFSFRFSVDVNLFGFIWLIWILFGLLDSILARNFISTMTISTCFKSYVMFESTILSPMARTFRTLCWTLKSDTIEVDYMPRCIIMIVNRQNKCDYMFSVYTVAVFFMNQIAWIFVRIILIDLIYFGSSKSNGQENKNGKRLFNHEQMLKKKHRIYFMSKVNTYNSTADSQCRTRNLRIILIPFFLFVLLDCISVFRYQRTFPSVWFMWISPFRRFNYFHTKNVRLCSEPN